MVEVFAIQTISEKRFLDLREKMLSLLGNKRKERVSKFRFHKDAQRSILGDIMVRSVISEKLQIKNNQITFHISERGKPSLSGYHELFFNASHAGDWVVAVFSDHEIGIDVERIKKISYNVAEQFFSSEENIKLNNLEGEAKLEYFFDLWTMKESYLKYTGKGLSEPLNSFTVKKSENRFTLSHSNIKEIVYLKQYDFEKGYKLAVCSAVNDFSEEIKVLDIEECLEQLLQSYS